MPPAAKLMRRRSEAGLTLVEALIVLTISSMVLTLVFQITGQAVSQNVRLGARALDSVDIAFEERLYRRVLASIVAPLQQEGQDPPKQVLAGNATGFRATVSIDRDAGCAAPGAYAPVEFVIERQGDGGRLLCRGGLGAYEILNWPAGAAAFSYSADGQNWSDVWPADDRFSTLDAFRNTERPLTAAERALQALERGFVEVENVDAPLVWLRVPGPDGRPRHWIARAGAVTPVAPPRPEFTLSDGRRADEFAIP